METPVVEYHRAISASGGDLPLPYVTVGIRRQGGTFQGECGDLAYTTLGTHPSWTLVSP